MPELGHPLDQLEVELVLDVVLDRDREDALVDEGADGVLDQPLLVGELEVHAEESRFSVGNAYASAVGS